MEEDTERCLAGQQRTTTGNWTHYSLSGDFSEILQHYRITTVRRGLRKAVKHHRRKNIWWNFKLTKQLNIKNRS